MMPPEVRRTVPNPPPPVSPAVWWRAAFVPTLFAFLGQQPVVLKPPYDRLAAAATPFELWAALVTGDAAAQARASAALAAYDAIVFTDRNPLQLPPHPCLQPVFAQATFQIFTVRHAEGCP